MERLYNIREGISRRDDTLPYRVMWEEIPYGPMATQNTPPQMLEEMLNNYYHLRGWGEDGVPTAETIRRLDLEDYFLW